MQPLCPPRSTLIFSKLQQRFNEIAEVGSGSLIIGGGSIELGAGSVNKGAGSKTRGAGSSIRRDPAEFKPWRRLKE